MRSIKKYIIQDKKNLIIKEEEIMENGEQASFPLRRNKRKSETGTLVRSTHDGGIDEHFSRPPLKINLFFNQNIPYYESAGCECLIHPFISFLSKFAALFWGKDPAGSFCCYILLIYRRSLERVQKYGETSIALVNKRLVAIKLVHNHVVRKQMSNSYPAKDT
jgi:hypothetical protein